MNEDFEMLWDTFLLLHQLSLVVFVALFFLVGCLSWTSWDPCIPWVKFVHLWLHLFIFVNVNLLVRYHRSATKKVSGGIERELRFFAGDWSQVHLCLPHAWKGNGPKLQLRAQIMLLVDSLSFLIENYTTSLFTEVVDGSSNVQEVWKLLVRQIKVSN